MCFAVVSQAHETRFNSFAATSDAEITVGFTVHVGKRRELWKLARLLLNIWQVTSQDRPWREGRSALWAAVHTHVVKLIPVDFDTLQAVDVTAGNGDRVS